MSVDLEFRLVADASAFNKAMGEVKKTSQTAADSVNKAVAGGVGLLLSARAAGVMARALSGAAKAAFEFASEAGNLRRELDPFFERGLLPAVDTTAMDQVAASLDAVKVAAQGAGLSFLQEFAPAIKTGAIISTAFILVVNDVISSLDRLIQPVKDLGRWYLGLSGTAKMALGSLSPLSSIVLQNASAIGVLSTGLSDTTIASSEYLTRAAEIIGTQEDLTRSTRNAASAAKAQADAAKRQAAEAKEEAKRQADAARAQQEYTSALGSLQSEERRATEEQLSGIAAVKAAQEDRLAHLQVLRAAALQNAKDEAQRAAADAAYQQAAVAVILSSQAQIDKIKDEAAAADLARQQQQTANSLDAASTLTRGIADASSAMATQMAESGKRGALAMFRVSQAAGIAQIGIDTAVAVVKALATLGPIAGGIATAGIILTGATQAAAVAAQKPPSVKHMGGSIAPDEVDLRTPGGASIRALRREGVVSPRGMDTLGESGLNAVNSGRMPGGSSPGVAVVSYKNFRNVLDREAGRSLRSRSTRLSRAVRQASSDTGSRKGW